MFDTSLVRSRAVAAPSRYGLLTASVILHSALVAAAITASVSATRFPLEAPDQLALFRPVDPPIIPPPLGIRPAQPRPRPAAPSAPHQAVTPGQIPDEIPMVEPGVAASAVDGGIGRGEAPVGDPNGVVGGVGEVPTAVQPEPRQTPFVPGGEVHPARVLHRVQPAYPASMIPIRLQNVTVRVHAVIDKEGHIRDARVVDSSWTPFNEAVLRALEQWTFAPGTLRGQPVDTYFELTVRFQVR